MSTKSIIIKTAVLAVAGAGIYYVAKRVKPALDKKLQAVRDQAEKAASEEAITKDAVSRAIKGAAHASAIADAANVEKAASDALSTAPKDAPTNDHTKSADSQGHAAPGGAVSQEANNSTSSTSALPEPDSIPEATAADQQPETPAPAGDSETGSKDSEGKGS